MAIVPQITVGDKYREISWMKSGPEWMTKFRLRALQIFEKEMPTWGANLSKTLRRIAHALNHRLVIGFESGSPGHPVREVVAV